MNTFQIVPSAQLGPRATVIVPVIINCDVAMAATSMRWSALYEARAAQERNAQAPSRRSVPVFVSPRVPYKRAKPAPLWACVVATPVTGSSRARAGPAEIRIRK